jgi:hypothetical protein
LGSLEVQSLPLEEAAAELRSDPFCVREEVIAAQPLDLLIRYSAEKRRIKLVARIGSTAQKIIKRTPGALFSGFDSAYVVPVEQLPTLLKKLRDKQVSFAVDTAAGSALAGSSALRKEVLAEPERFTSDELSLALLTPFIAEVSGEQVSFRPCFFTTEQFKLAFPGVRRQQGKVFTLDERGLLQFIGRAKSLPFPVWLSCEVHQYVARKREQLAGEVNHAVGVVDDVAADLISVPLLWRTAQSGRAALAVGLPEQSEVRALIVARLGEVVGCSYAEGGAVALLEVPDSKLLMAFNEVETLCAVHGLSSIPKSESFVKLEAHSITSSPTASAV